MLDSETETGGDVAALSQEQREQWGREHGYALLSAHEQGLVESGLDLASVGAYMSAGSWLIEAGAKALHNAREGYPSAWDDRSTRVERDHARHEASIVIDAAKEAGL